MIKKTKIEAIWKELNETGEYTPAWKPNKAEESEKAAEEICEAIIKELGGKIKVIRCCGTRTNHYVKDGKTFAIFHTYDFENFNSSEEPGFAESSHYTIKCWGC